MYDRSAARAALTLALLLLARSLPLERAAERPRAAPPERGAARLLWALPLDLNRENARDFEALPGIGPARAAAIVAGRPYCTLADLDRVPGFGPATLRGLSQQVEVGVPPAPCALSPGH